LYPLFNPIVVIVTVYAILIAVSSSYAIPPSGDNPGGDQPDESFILGDALYPTRLEDISLNLDVDSRVAILDSGYSREAALFLGLFLPVRFVSEREFSPEVSSISLLIIPSGGLSFLEDPEGFGRHLRRFVEKGGRVFVFSQRFGKEYALLPLSEGEDLDGYGWLEDQSLLTRSTIMTLWHPLVSDLTTSRPHLHIDGFFISIPNKGKPILRNSISGQPVLLLYNYGKGVVIASTLYADWAYLHTNTTRDEIALFSRLLRWAGLTLSPTAPKGPDKVKGSAISPAPLPAVGFSIQSDHEIYLLGSTATFTINIWNYERRDRKIKVYYDGKSEVVHMAPQGFARLVYSIPVYSTRRLWVYFYDEGEIFLQTLRKGYSVVYPSTSEGDRKNR